MARSIARIILASLLATVMVLRRSAPRAFIGAHAAASATAGSMTAGTAFDIMPQVLDAQLLLSRNFGGKFAKAKDLTAPVPDQEGFSDAQVAVCLCIALVAGLCAWDLAKTLERGATPNRFKDPKSKGGYITPLYKRFIEMGE